MKKMSATSRRLMRKNAYFITLTATALLLHVASLSKERAEKVWLTFDTCGGFANQLLSISFVMTYAIVSEVDVLVSPSVAMNGMQIQGIDQYTETREENGFSKMFDWSTTYTFLQKYRVALVSPEDSSAYTRRPIIICKKGETLERCTRHFKRCKRKGMALCHVHIECPFLHTLWNVSFLKQHREIFDDALNNLTPSSSVKRIASTAIDIIRNTGSAGCSTFVHLRVEKDWQEHCKIWLPAVVRARKDDSINCLVSIPDIIEHLRWMKVSHCTIVFAYDGEDTDAETQEQILRQMHSRTLRILNMGEILLTANIPREMRAAVAAFIAQDHSDFFVGNSVSTLSATIIRQRRRRNLWASQYNNGTIPLSEFVPGFRIPWIFTVRGTDRGYDQMMKVAVDSALQKSSLLPYVMSHPDESKYDRVAWLRARGVHICIHRPTWEARLLEILHNSSESAQKRSHLYAFPEMVLGTFFRLDVAVLPELLQFEHILYTDTDVLFNGDITELQGEGLKLPSTIQLAIEQPGLAVLNAGVYFASMRYLRESHSGLIKTLLSSTTIDYGSYGPGDQGLLNMYYKAELEKEGLLSEDRFNSKSYRATKQARIIHFHGPKPSDYEEAARTGSCKRFPTLCDVALGSEFFCELINMWFMYCTEDCSTYRSLIGRCRVRD